MTTGGYLAADEIAALDGWLGTTAPEVGRVTRSWLISGGRSNLTLGLETDRGRGYCLRQAPRGQTGTHDVAREYRILDLVGATPVPVPRVVGLCADPAVLGQDFFLMELVEGLTCDTRTSAAALDLPARLRAGSAMVEVLTLIHDLDLDASPIGEIARRDGYIDRQLRRWKGQMTDEDVARRPLIAAVGDLLTREQPATQRVSLVHGDFKIGNCLLLGSGEVAAVLDWELTTLGDPLADLGWLVASWETEPPDAPRIVEPPAAFGGFADAAELVARYAHRSSLDLSVLPFYVALAEWRWALIDIGIARRFRAGVMGGREVDLDKVEAEIDSRLQRAIALLGHS